MSSSEGSFATTVKQFKVKRFRSHRKLRKWIKIHNSKNTDEKEEDRVEDSIALPNEHPISFPVTESQREHLHSCNETKGNAKNNNFLTTVLAINMIISIITLILVSQIKVTCSMEQSKIVCNTEFAFYFLKTQPPQDITIVYLSSVRQLLRDETIKYFNEIGIKYGLRFQESSSNNLTTPYVVADIVNTIRTSEVIPCSGHPSAICMALRPGSECEKFHPLDFEKPLFEFIAYNHEMIACDRNMHYANELMAAIQNKLQKKEL